VKYNLNRQKVDERDHIFQPTDVDLDKEFDLEPSFPETPYNQLKLGSCTSQMGAAMVAVDQAKQGVPYLRPSRLWIYWNNRYRMGGWQATFQDTGSTIRDTMKSLADGWVPETKWKYKDDPITYTIPAPRFPWMKVEQKAVVYESVPQDEKSISSALDQGLVIGFGIMVYESFESASVAKTGIVPNPDTKRETLLGGHAITICGKKVIDGKKYFKFRNSWSEKWGDKGYGYLPAEFVLDPNMSSDFWVLRSIA
jgi:hypothetical protein